MHCISLHPHLVKIHIVSKQDLNYFQNKQLVSDDMREHTSLHTS